MEKLTIKETVEELRKEWKTLWQERIDDKLRAEAIANTNYSRLFVEKGTVIFATRNFKMASFRDILELHGIVDVDGAIPPSPHVGGWGKFIRTIIANQSPKRRNKRALHYAVHTKQKQQLKKGGRGWLHF